MVARIHETGELVIFQRKGGEMGIFIFFFFWDLGFGAKLGGPLFGGLHPLFQSGVDPE